MPISTQYFVLVNSPPVAVPGYPAIGSYDDAVTGLSNGGYAVVVEDNYNYADLNIYTAYGTLVASNTSFDAVDTKIAQLSNGNILVVGTSNNTLAYRVFNLSGQVIDAGTVDRYDNLSHVSLVTTANSQFATAAQRFFAGTNNDIYVTLPGLTAPVIIDSSVADDENPSIAQLANGDFAVAWERIDSSTHYSAIWYAILKPNGDFRQMPVLADSTGSINTHPSVVALQNGGFAISYQDNEWSGGNQTDIAQRVYSAAGGLVSAARLTNSTNTDIDANSAALPGGLSVTVFSSQTGGDSDIHVAATDAAGNVIDAGTNLAYAATADYESNANIAALANGRMVISFADQTSGVVKTGIYYLQRDTTGDQNDNIITGDTIDDVIFGGDGNDIIAPGAGAGNEVAGGAGYDTLVLDGPSTSYIISRSGVETYATGPDGSWNQMNGIEKLQFSDRNVYIAPEVRDLDGSGYSDMVLQNSDGEIRVWAIASDGTLAGTDRTTATPSAAWKVVGTGQFDFAANSYDDILMQNSNGKLQVYEMNSHTVIATVALPTLAPGWQVVTTGDFNGDGQADIVMQDVNNGQIRVWMMNGTTMTSKTDIGSQGYSVIDTGDFNGDGKSDILAQHNSQVYVWLMNGSTRLETDKVGAPLATGWQAVSSGDFNGDGKSDILMWNSSTGAVRIWEMNGASVIAAVQVGTASAGYHPTGSGDFNGDGTSDIVFQKSDGHVQEWLMAGGAVTAKITVGSPGSTWALVAGTGG